jgi:hypothetical protein
MGMVQKLRVIHHTSHHRTEKGLVLRGKIAIFIMEHVTEGNVFAQDRIPDLFARYMVLLSTNLSFSESTPSSVE